MQRWVVFFVLSVMLCGCGARRQTVRWLRVNTDDYDAVWNATHEVMDKHFRVEVSDKEAGTIKTRYEMLTPLTDPLELKMVLQSTFQVLRRRATAKVSRQDEGITVRVHVAMEREETEDDEKIGGRLTDHYDLYERTEQRNMWINQNFDTAWYPIGRDYKKEKAVLEAIKRRLD